VGSNNDHSGQDYVYAGSQTFSMDSWSVGLTGFDGLNSNGGYNVFSDLTLVQVSSTASVPEPGTLALFGLGAGILVFAAARRRTA
jgi:hypothetical protein